MLWTKLSINVKICLPKKIHFKLCLIVFKKLANLQRANKKSKKRKLQTIKHKKIGIINE